MTSIEHCIETKLIAGKKIALFVSGSIAIYKSLELIRWLIKSDALVRVVMSAKACAFITPLTFEALSQNKVLTDNTESWADDNNHIDIGKWADIGIIAPASSNTINKIAQGIADNILTTALLAFKKPVVVAVAANTYMYEHPATQDSLQRLHRLTNYTFCTPQERLLVCGDRGLGAMAFVEDIFYEAMRQLCRDSKLSNSTIIVTAGGTIEPIDSVRYISNFSSGKMGYYMALAAYLKGACVIFIHTTDKLDTPFTNIRVKSAIQMEEALNRAVKALSVNKSCDKPSKNFLFMAAAVSDYRPKSPSKGKLKKDDLGEEWHLQLTQNSDILAQVDKKHLCTIGFKAELDEKGALTNAKKMLKHKNLDGVLLNILQDSDSFGTEEQAFTFIDGDHQQSFPKAYKLTVALAIIDHIMALKL